jgi:hypothetical protein
MLHVRKLLVLGGLGLLSLALTGCKYDRDDRDQSFYNDVGETDIDRRVYASERRNGHAEINPAEQTKLAQKQQHYHEVGEMSLDLDTADSAPVVKSKKAEKAKEVKPVSAAPVKAEPVKAAPVAPKPVTVVPKPAPVAPVAVEPIRRVPAPQPMPAYTASVSKSSHSSVGEVDLGN